MSGKLGNRFLKMTSVDRMDIDADRMSRTHPAIVHAGNQAVQFEGGTHCLPGSGGSGKRDDDPVAPPVSRPAFLADRAAASRTLTPVYIIELLCCAGAGNASCSPPSHCRRCHLPTATGDAWPRTPRRGRAVPNAYRIRPCISGAFGGNILCPPRCGSADHT